MNGVDLFEFCTVGGSIFLAMCAVSYIRNDIKKGRKTIISLILDPVETYFQNKARKKKIFENIKKMKTYKLWSKMTMGQMAVFFFLLCFKKFEEKN